MLKSAVLWYYFMQDMLLPYVLKLPVYLPEVENLKYGKIIMQFV